MARIIGRVLVAGAVAATLLASAGCSVRAQTAFSVDDDVTTVSQVTDTVNGCAAAMGEASSALSASAMADLMVQVQLTRAIAASQNVQVSDDDLTMLIQNGQIQGLPASLLSDPNCAQLAVGLALQAVIISQSSSDAYVAAAADHAVVVNPRFGTWDPSDLSLSGSGSLSQPGK